MTTKKDFFLTQEKRDRIKFKNVLVKVFEDAREGGGRRQSKKSKRKMGQKC